MLQFKELRITPNNSHLIIDVAVKNDSYYNKVVIDSIVIDTQDSYVANGPSNKPVYTFKVNAENVNNIYAIPEDCSCNPVLAGDDLSQCFTYGLEESKNVRLILSAKDIPLANNMFFVYAIATGTPSPDTPCGFDNSVLMGTVVNLYPFYQNTICYLKEINNDCQTPKGFVDMILRLKALELCIRTGNYTQAIKYWKKFFCTTINQIPTYNCTCNGRSN